MSYLQEQIEEHLSDNLEGCKNAKVYEDWNPPIGEHTALIYGYKDGVSKKNKLWWRLECRMLDSNPGLVGKEFYIWFNQTAIGILKSAASILADRNVEALREAMQTLKDSMGKTISIQTTYNKGYTNHRILGLIPDTSITKASHVSTKE